MKFFQVIFLLLLASASFADPIESMMPKINGGDEPQSFSFDSEPIGFQRDYSETTVDYAGAPFRKALQATSSETLKVTPTEGLTFNLGQKRQQQQSLRQDS